MKDNEYIFIIKSLKSKGYDIDEVIKMDSDDIKKLQFSRMIIEGILSYKEKGITISKIENDIFEKRYTSDTEVKTSDIKQYIQNTEEQDKVLTSIQEEAKEEIPEDVIVVEHKLPEKEDLDIIKESLQQKEMKTVSKYVKHLKDTVPSAILTSVDSIIINELIEERISEVKASNENTK